MKNLIEFCKGLGECGTIEPYLELHTSAERARIAEEAIALTNRILLGDTIPISAGMLRAIIVDAIDGVQQWRASGEDHYEQSDGEWMDADDVNRLPDVIMEKVIEEVASE